MLNPSNLYAVATAHPRRYARLNYSHYIETRPTSKTFSPTSKHYDTTKIRALSLAEANAASAPIVMLTLRLLTNLPKHSGTRSVIHIHTFFYSCVCRCIQLPAKCAHKHTERHMSVKTHLSSVPNIAHTNTHSALLLSADPPLLARGLALAATHATSANKSIRVRAHVCRVCIYEANRIGTSRVSKGVRPSRGALRRRCRFPSSYTNTNTHPLSHT